LDSNDNHTDFKVPESLCQVWLVLIEPGGIPQINLLVKFDLKRLLDNPFEEPPEPVPVPFVQGKLFDWGD